MTVRIPAQATSDYGHAQLLLIREQWLKEARAEIEADATAESLCDA
jgi:hypothetical protein